MSALQTLHEGDRTVSEEELQAILGRAERLRRLGRNRAAAASLLQAATVTRSVVERECLRRRGALLISSRTNDRGRRLAC